uniref:SET domain-containing protein n=1 Tax=Strigamia maritima TaxID=126957 RepID=T1IRX0_STRMM
MVEDGVELHLETSEAHILNVYYIIIPPTPLPFNVGRIVTGFPPVLLSRDANLVVQNMSPKITNYFQTSCANTKKENLEENLYLLQHDHAYSAKSHTKKEKKRKKEKMNRKLNNSTTKSSTKQTLTDYFPVRRSFRKSHSKLLKEKKKDFEEAILSQCEDGLMVETFSHKGRGVRATKHFRRGDFVVEYYGELIDVQEAKRREKIYSIDENTGCYISVDATAESNRMGRLINHSRHGNLTTKPFLIHDVPHLILIAKQDIEPGEELLYDYGDRGIDMQPDIRTFFSSPMKKENQLGEESDKISMRKRKLNDYSEPVTTIPTKRRILSLILHAEDSKSKGKIEKIETLLDDENDKYYPHSCFIESFFIDDDWRLSLRNYTKLISPRNLIPANVIRKLIDNLLLNGPCEAAASQMYFFLNQMLRITNPSLGNGILLVNISLTKVDQLSSIKIAKKSHKLFLHFLESLFEQDFAAFIRSPDAKKQLNSATGRPMIVRLLWGTKSTLSLNNSCSELLKYLVASINNAASYTTILALQKLNALMFESARLSEAQDGVVDDIPYNAIKLIQRLIEHIRSDNLSGENLLLLLDSMVLPWCRMLLAQMLLDSSSRNTTERMNNELTLGKIINYYMKSTPMEKFEKPEAQNTKENIMPTSEKNRSRNRRNAKGETALHTACIHNRVETVRKLLSHPEIDVNAVDNAGWTPLHEACNRGNIDCVRQLLGSETTPHIDVMSKNVDGITPLHDAVMNDHVEIARLLLDHGGRVLLDQIDNADRLPIDFAVSSTMSSLLLNFDNDTKRFEDNKVEKYVMLVLNLLNGYLDTHCLKEMSEKSNVDDVEKYKELDCHITQFNSHVNELMMNPKEILLLDLFKLYFLI